MDVIIIIIVFDVIIVMDIIMIVVVVVVVVVISLVPVCTLQAVDGLYVNVVKIPPTTTHVRFRLEWDLTLQPRLNVVSQPIVFRCSADAIQLPSADIQAVTQPIVFRCSDLHASGPLP